MSDKENKKENPTSFFPSPAFNFALKINNDTAGTGQVSFQEVSGISMERDVVEVAEGGVNSFVHQVPVIIKYQNLVLKRGVAAKNTVLLKWLESVMGIEQLNPIKPKTLRVGLLDAENKMLTSWVFQDAYPVKWTIADFESMENYVAIETLEFAYSFFTVD